VTSSVEQSQWREEVHKKDTNDAETSLDTQWMDMYET
jgi:hypothetical protein